MSNRVEQIVGKIKEQVSADLPALVHRDRQLLSDVCKELGLADDQIHQAQVAVLMRINGLATHEEYPKWVYPNGPDKPGVLVNNAATERAAMRPKVAK